MKQIAFLRLTPPAALLVAAAVALILGVPADKARAQACTADQFAEAVDQAGANLRKITQAMQPRLDAKLKQLQAARGWSDADYLDKGYAAIADARTAQLERQANELLEKVDSLGQVNAKSPPECSRLQALEAASLELQATVRAKANHAIARLDTLIAPAAAPAAAAKAPAPAAPQPPAKAQAAAPPTAAPKQQQTAAATPLPPAPSITPPPPASGPATAPPTSEPAPSWSTTTTPSNDPPGVRSDDGYTVDEIMLASTGFFGKVSAGLGSIIEHAFSSVGRPTGYILGTEGGGAFLAGLRYGSGTLYMRTGGTQPIHWHGPSLGTDIGAAGAKVMFLIYRLRDPEQMHNAFTGIEGSAFVVGGVGFTLLTNGDVQMAPIRSGIGLRVGASVGYLRFTKKPTWNPF